MSYDTVMEKANNDVLLNNQEVKILLRHAIELIDHVYDLTQQNIFRLKSNQKMDAEAEKLALKQALTNGSLSAQSPCDSMYSEWTDEAKGRLKSALGDVFGWKRKLC